MGRSAGRTAAFCRAQMPAGLPQAETAGTHTDSRKDVLGHSDHGRSGIPAELPKPAPFLLGRGTFGDKGRDLHQNGILTYLFNLFPRNTNIGGPSEAECAAFPGDKNRGNAPLAQIHLIIAYMTELSRIAHAYYDLSRQAVCIARHDKHSF